ncbi:MULTISPECIES: DsbE family thiol:disulfide interchange protein [Vibrio]|uniref:DsbE family thiol:disulfide interchange protein n=1 Tax=Vibrio TaxID=662 RepID=UPI00029A736A|nr:MULTISPECIES: DsbE family thiol:disulfide interchange protein [Vibrio]KNH13998.1 thiol:disulfide interchange protein DsbE [Vibrio lentus]MBY7662791.1 DsbE family thiol:disulfide interchange protein [Vibrio atlanticus]KAA8597083.1 Cytochrome c-type biogenesis protein CcmG/DsbE thiol:disulfide oxidoreductase [Vibrio cyclitrophicus]MBE8604752.1 DsbE family thiol:disulfide interchange protein [Vibrio sp. OPT10]MBU2930505.1 DsbE family thiol:disulfide interchange protein [Vibrio cyclitrophicus]|tara:strand:+ start:1377 stop:1931 length:555 start_codon:yes stop_codon:yes gene_type:complete
MHTSVRNKLITLIVLALIVVLGFVFALDSKQQTTSVSEQKRAFPEFISTALVNSESVSGQQEITLADVTQHPYQLVNVWASWCGICKTEHAFLTELRKKGIPIVGLNYRDNSGTAINVLLSDGNPYSVVISDPQGKLALELGVIGTPETYLVDANGQIIKKLLGVINETVWKDELAMYFDGVNG